MPVCLVVSSGGSAEPVRMNWPLRPRSSQALRMAFHTPGASCHSSSSRGTGPSQDLPRGYLRCQAVLEDFIERHLAARVVPAGPCLAAGARPFDHHRG